jgi:hypothetical protein
VISGPTLSGQPGKAVGRAVGKLTPSLDGPQAAAVSRGTHGEREAPLRYGISSGSSGSLSAVCEVSDGNNADGVDQDDGGRPQRLRAAHLFARSTHKVDQCCGLEGALEGAADQNEPPDARAEVAPLLLGHGLRLPKARFGSKRLPSRAFHCDVTDRWCQLASDGYVRSLRRRMRGMRRYDTGLRPRGPDYWVWIARTASSSPVRAATRLGSSCRGHLAYSSLAAYGAARPCADGIVLGTTLIRRRIHGRRSSVRSRPDLIGSIG